MTIFTDPQSLFIGMLTLPAVAGIICAVASHFGRSKGPQIESITAVRLSTNCISPHASFGALSLIDAYDPETSILWENQIAMLELIAAGVSTNELAPLWVQCVDRYPELYEGVSFREWLRFLESCGLAERTGNRVSLTADGQSFVHTFRRAPTPGEEGTALHSEGGADGRNSGAFPP